MADNMPPNRDFNPNNPDRNPGKPKGDTPNWGMWVMLVIVVTILLLAFTSPDSFGFGKQKESIAQFEEDYKDGRIILNHPKKYPITVLLSDASPDAVIMASRYKSDVSPELSYEPFVMTFNSGLVDDNFKKRLDEAGIIQPSGLASPESALTGKSISTDAFSRLVAEGRITGREGDKSPKMYYDGSIATLSGRIVTRKWPEVGGEKAIIERVEVPFSVHFDGSRIKDLLGDTAEYRTESSGWRTFIFYFLPILLLIGLMFFMFRAQTGGAKGAMNFGKSRAKLISPEKNKITFKDVAGVNEAKEEVWELVEFLKNPAKFREIGGSIPKGVLLVGSPGTGKTLLAKAIAGEADVPFYSISGSDFVEMFVGVGASRVRDMFEQAKKSAPCLIFIDEIDAVGRHRGYGVGGSHDEREQTLNALLVEMDGFDANENVIVIAATNRADVLDPALLRPGRFDREVVVNLPDVKGREQILLVHAKKVKLAKDADMAPIARGTAGFSGAELANLINEAALLAARKGLKEVRNIELEEARDKVRWGKERRSLTMSDKDKRITAVHEAGHAICLLKTDNSEPLHKVTIIPRGQALGATMWLPKEDRYHMRRSEMLDTLVVAMGGRCAEQIVFGDVTSGAVGDIRMATNMARRMVCEYGMSEKLGFVEYGEQTGEVFLARDLGTRSRNYSEQTAQTIDEEIRTLVENAYTRCLAILEDNRAKLEAISEALLEYETLTGEQVQDLLEKGFMTNPPESVGPPPLPSEEQNDNSEQQQDDSSNSSHGGDGEQARKEQGDDTPQNDGSSSSSDAPEDDLDPFRKDQSFLK
ncbi:ATP-dependent zinc metalloprotease FtsH [Akkermansia sp. N21169]|uniref:ATP-dependent zinc metalloprotease FtsH n=1 Tax=Akkermansia sp. N21169 TaxID=3040765 RepID=UPI00244E8434|nr:ATP-dependent zinc metalloprotease FtsH [Akkermansia sp. N21169]MDH3068651.1 ATP-dependent zinc metalloprotease FtsH [Akkermansia sp. N21169]